MIQIVKLAAALAPPAGRSGSVSRPWAWSSWPRPAGCSCPRTSCTLRPRPLWTSTCTGTFPRLRPRCCLASSATLSTRSTANSVQPTTTTKKKLQINTWRNIRDCLGGMNSWDLKWLLARRWRSRAFDARTPNPDAEVEFVAPDWTEYFQEAKQEQQERQTGLLTLFYLHFFPSLK